ncbi:TonB-dependent receptor plug domain-containing protein [Sphingomonas sp. UYP23]
MHRNTTFLLATTAAFAQITSAGAARAQAIADAVSQEPSAPATTSDAVDKSQEIVVTGSRIARTGLTSSTPVSVISTQAIQNTGQGNIQDIVGELPSVGTPNLSRSSSNFLSSGNGSATLNLRNLGQSRTLALINGRRSVGVPGGSALDVNNVPTDMVDRIEVLTGGASATYGSDAVAGVVNFVLKEKFDGLRLRAQNTISDKGDAARQLVSVTGGQSFADDRGHVIANFTFDNDQGLRSANRGFSARDTTNSSYAAQGLFSVDGNFSGSNGKTFTFDRSNNLKAYQGAAVDGYNRNGDRYLAVPVQRLQGAALANFQFSDALKLYAEGEYSHVSSRSSLEPAPVANAGAGAATNFDGSPLAGIPITNPFIPDAIRAAMITAGTTALPFRRRSNDIFSRSNDDRRDYWRAVGGLKGDVGAWHYDVSYEHSEDKERTQTQNISAAAYGAALNSVRDGSGNIVCADPAARAAGCVPINIFGFNTVTPAAAAFLQKYPGASNPALGLVQGASLTYLDISKVQQDDVALNVTGTLFRLPGGPATVAVGGEYRREASSDLLDPYTRAGVTTGNQIGNTVGSFDVKEEYVEAVFPILKDRPFVNFLQLEGAFRHADYSTSGSVNSYKFGGEYAPVPDLRFRAVYAQATRAPNIVDLYQNNSQTFYGSISDPCDQGAGLGDRATTLRTLPAACSAIPGVSATVARNGSFTYTTAQLQGVDGLLGGNTKLQPETAHTLTAGVVFTPRAIRGFSLTVDYYRINIENAIGTIDQNLSVQQCVATSNPVFCSSVVRNAAGFVTRVNTLSVNTGTAKVAGIDVQANYARHFGTNDALTLNVYWNHLLKQQTVPYPGGDVQNEVGQSDTYPNGTRLGSGFRDRVFGTATLQHGPVNLNYRLDYMSGVSVDNSDPTAQRIPAYLYHNVQLRFDIDQARRFQFFAGVNNMFDKKPPVVSDAYNYPGTNTIASSYDLYGRMLYSGVDVKF